MYSSISPVFYILHISYLYIYIRVQTDVYIHVCVYVYIYIYRSIFLSVHVSIYLWFHFLSIYSMYPPVCISIRLLIYPSKYQSIYQQACIQYLSICLTYLSTYVSIIQTMHLSVHLPNYPVYPVTIQRPHCLSHLSTSASWSIYESVYLPTPPSINRSIYLNYLSTCLYLGISFFSITERWSMDLFASLSGCLSNLVYSPLCLSMYIATFGSVHLSNIYQSFCLWV